MIGGQTGDDVRIDLDRGLSLCAAFGKLVPLFSRWQPIAGQGGMLAVVQARSGRGMTISVIDWSRIQCQVGDSQRVIDHDLFIDTHERLAVEYRARGLTGLALDTAIANNLPRRLAQILDGTVYHWHGDP